MIRILSSIFYLIQTISACVLLEEYLLRNYPEFHEKFKKLFINQSYNAIYFYSKLEIIYNKYKPYIRRYIKKFIEHPVTSKIIGQEKKIIHDIEFVIDGSIVYKTTKENMIEFYNDITKQPETYDFIIYSDYSTIENDDNKCINKKIMNKRPIKDSDFEYNNSDVKFVLCEFSLGSKNFKVDFKNSSSNYYVVDNIFDVKFLKYFLQKYYSEDIKDMHINCINDFKINIIDQNIKNIISDKENIIKLSKDNYELLNPYAK